MHPRIINCALQAKQCSVYSLAKFRCGRMWRVQFRVFQFKLRKPLESPLYIWPKNFSAPYCTESSPPNPCCQHDIMILFTWTMPCGKVKLKVEDEDEKDDEDNSGSGDNGESKLVFVLHSRHEALVGTKRHAKWLVQVQLEQVLAQLVVDLELQVHCEGQTTRGQVSMGDPCSACALCPLYLPDCHTFSHHQRLGQSLCWRLWKRRNWKGAPSRKKPCEGHEECIANA